MTYSEKEQAQNLVNCTGIQLYRVKLQLEKTLPVAMHPDMQTTFCEAIEALKKLEAMIYHE